MTNWIKISGLLCVFGFAKELRPSEPYITEYLLGGWRNITQDQVNREVYPIGTYSNLAQLIIVFLITDFLRYKPLIIVNGLAGIVIWSMLIWTTSLLSLQILEVVYGTYMALEVAYYTYIYAKVDKKYYSRVTSHTRAAMFTGKLAAGISSQLLHNFHVMDYKQLNYISLAAQIFATIWAIFLPSVNKSLYFHRIESVTDKETIRYQAPVVHRNDSISNISIKMDMETQKEKSAFALLWQHFCNAYTNIRVLQWSLWYSIGLCGYMQVTSYIQVLWKDIEANPSIAWNGAVDAVLTTLAALSALCAGYLRIERLSQTYSLFILAVLSACEGGAILICVWTNNIYWCYAGFILFGGFYGFTITIASSEVARYLEEDSYGLVFGINTFIALALQSLLTFIVISENGLGLSAQGQFTVYAFYFIVIALIYLIATCVQYALKLRAQKHVL